MNKRAFYLSLVYSFLVIAFKLFILLGGYTLSKFGFYYSNFVSVLFIIPFLFLVIYLEREKVRNGIIAGRDAVKIALTVMALSAIFMSIYNYIEFNWKYKDIATYYYNSGEYLNILKQQQRLHPDKIKETMFPKIIEEQIAQLSAFKATTGKLIPLMMIGFAGSFIAAILLKKSKTN